MSVDDTLMCSFQILKPAEKKQKLTYGAGGRPVTPPKSKVLLQLTYLISSDKPFNMQEA